MVAYAIGGRIVHYSTSICEILPLARLVTATKRPEPHY